MKSDDMRDARWQLEEDAAELYQRYLVPAVTMKWAVDLVDRAQLRSGDAVLDLACGTGAVTRLAAKKVGNGRVVGLDLNPAMLAVARGVSSEGAPITWIEGSALKLPFSSHGFDAVLCQLGLQFFPDQQQGLREMCRVLRNSGRVALSVYSPIEQTPGANAFVLALDEVLGEGSSRIKRGEHSFVARAQLEALLEDAGFAAIDVQTVVQTISFPSVLDYVRFQLLATPMAALLEDDSESDRQSIIAAVASKTAALSTPAMLDGGRFTFPQEAYVGVARSVR
jgi:ubiquinone/menaquinone biosynthesis C-methylase UbiE